MAGNKMRIPRRHEAVCIVFNLTMIFKPTNPFGDAETRGGRDTNETFARTDTAHSKRDERTSFGDYRVKSPISLLKWFSFIFQCLLSSRRLVYITRCVWCAASFRSPNLTLLK